MNPHYILALNSGSSSLKFAVCEFDGARERLLLRGEAENIGAPSGHLWLRTADGSSIVDQLRPISDHQTAVQIALDELKKGKYPSPAAIGHRVVNSGRLSAPQKITPQDRKSTRLNSRH